MRRVTRTSCQSTPSSSEHSVKFSETSAKPSGLRDSAPLKMTSAISPPRSDLADCSPKTQRTASQTLDFPQPFGPTMAVTPSWKLMLASTSQIVECGSSTARFLRARLRYVWGRSQLGSYEIQDRRNRQHYSVYGKFKQRRMSENPDDGENGERGDDFHPGKIERLT